MDSKEFWETVVLQGKQPPSQTGSSDYQAYFHRVAGASKMARIIFKELIAFMEEAREKPLSEQLLTIARLVADLSREVAGVTTVTLLKIDGMTNRDPR